MTDVEISIANGPTENGKEEINGNLPLEEIDKEMEGLSLSRRRTQSSPIYKTARTKLHDKRVVVNKDIHKQLRLLNGANNLLRVMNDRRLKSKVQVEVDYVHSNLQILKNELDGINSSLDVYQISEKRLPLIPLGFKQSNNVDFLVPFSDYILEHYSEDPRPYRHTIAEMNSLRQKAVNLRRNEEGLEDLQQYIAALNVLDVRFFPPGRNISVHFEWFDSLTGEARMQSSVAFEKGSMFFNLAALYSQLAVNETLQTPESCEAARAHLCCSAGILRLLRDSFTNAPGMDMSADVLNFLIPLMLAQSQESEFSRLLHSSPADGDFERRADNELTLASETAWLREAYEQILATVADPTIPRDTVPSLWTTLARIKVSVYAAESLARSARCLVALTTASSPLDQAVCELLRELDSRRKAGPCSTSTRRPRTFDDMNALAKAMTMEAISCLDDAVGTARACRSVGEKMPGILSFFDFKQQEYQELFRGIKGTEDLGCSFVAFEVEGRAKVDPTPLVPATAVPTFNDPFTKLGPVNIFSSRHFWSPPRRVQLKRDPSCGFGFSIRGDAPVLIVEVDVEGPAERGGIKPGDFVVSVNEQDTKWAKHERVIEMVTESGDSLTLRVVTPLDTDYLQPAPSQLPSASGSVNKKAEQYNRSLGLRSNSSPPIVTSSTMPVKGGKKWRPLLSGSSVFRRRRSSSRHRDPIEME